MDIPREIDPQRLEQLLAAYGFSSWGVCRWEAVRDHLLPCRAACRLPPDARRVLMVVFPYRFPEQPGQRRNLSRYACVEDYHTVGGEVLEQAAGELTAAFSPYRFEPFVDNSPIPEVETAARCGLGVVGDHGLLIHPRFGSWIFLGSMVTNAPLPITEQEVGGCLHCGACVRACPGKCLPGRGRDTCLSGVTQRKGVLRAEEEELVRQGGLAWGCDRCQEVCPLNRTAETAPHPCFTSYQPYMTEGDLEDLTGKAYGWRGKAVPLRNLHILEETETSDP